MSGRKILLLNLRRDKPSFAACSRKSAKIDPKTPPRAHCRGATAAQKPGSHRAQRRFEGQPTPFKAPEYEHDKKGKKESPQSGVNQKEKDRGEGARVKREEPRRLLTVAPMVIHEGTEKLEGGKSLRVEEPRLLLWIIPQKSSKDNASSSASPSASSPEKPLVRSR